MSQIINGGDALRGLAKMLNANERGAEIQIQMDDGRRFLVVIHKMYCPGGELDLRVVKVP